MFTDDDIRELVKVYEAVSLAAKHLTLKNESDAALHCSDKVLYSPLTMKLSLARATLEKLLQT